MKINNNKIIIIYNYYEDTINNYGGRNSIIIHNIHDSKIK